MTSTSPAGWVETKNRELLAEVPHMTVDNRCAWLKMVINEGIARRDAALVEKVSGMKWDDDGQVADYDERNRVAHYCHNSALDAVISLITNREKV